MLLGIVLILVCQLIGEAVVTALGLRLPGPVLGMLLFLGVLVALPRVRRPDTTSGVHRAADRFLEYLPLFFVPAGVAVVQYLDVLARQPGPILLGLVGAWVATLATTAWVALLSRRVRSAPAAGPVEPPRPGPDPLSGPTP